MRPWLQPGRGHVAALVALAVSLPLALTCSNRQRPPWPWEIAVREPCRYTGTLHAESRVRLESLLSCHAVSHGEWECMARALAALDDELTGTCRERSVGFREVAGQQRLRYAECLAEPDPEVVDCAILTTDAECMLQHCA